MLDVSPSYQYDAVAFYVQATSRARALNLGIAIRSSVLYQIAIREFATLPGIWPPHLSLAQRVIGIECRRYQVTKAALPDQTLGARAFLSRLRAL